MSDPENLVYGLNSVRALLEEAPERIHKLYLLKGRRQARLEELLRLARERSVPVTFQPRQALDRVTSGASHQGIAAVTAPLPFTDFQEVVARAQSRGEAPLLVALDHIHDPHNLGAIARSSEAMGAHGLIIPRHRSAATGGAAEKAAAGALRHIPISRVPNIARTLVELKEMGLWVLGTAAEGGSPPWELSLTGSLVVVIGGEEKGVRPVVRSECDIVANIPLRGRTSSLNASVAAGIVLYEIFRQRASVQT